MDRADPLAPPPPPPPGPRSAGSALPLLIAAALVGALLRGIDAQQKSLWLDEFHSLYCAFGADLDEVVERVKPDFHPPLYFIWLHFLRDVPAHGLRWLGILAGLACLIPLNALGRRMGLSPRARGLAALAFAATPYQIWYGTELRAYPFLLLATLTLTWAAFTDSASRRTRFIAFALATCLGLYHHYFAAVAVVVVGGTRLFFRGPSLLKWWQLVAAGTIGVVPFLYWIAVDESWLFTDTGALVRTDKATEDELLPEGETVAPSDLFDVDWERVVNAPARLAIPRMGSLGGLSATLIKPAAALFFLAFAAGALRYLRALLRREDAPRDRYFFGVLATSVLGFTLTFFACLYAWNRLPEQYFVICAWGWPLAAGAFLDAFTSSRGRKLYAGAIALALLAAGTAHAFGASREDTRGGVERALAENIEGAIYTAVLWQPPWYSERIVFDVYAPEVDAREPWDIPRVEEPGGERPVVVVTRGRMWGPKPMRYKLWLTITPGRSMVREIQVDDETWVHVFERE